MNNSYEFLALVLDAITAHIVVIDEAGEIQYVNKSWSSFGNDNACVVGNNWKGINYIDECDKAASAGDEFGAAAGAGIRRVIEQRESMFYLEYPCHSPEEKRWFTMRVTPFILRKKSYFVISHQNITERKLAEEAVRKLARIDGLTGVPNRKTFDEFLSEEWRRCARLNQPICLAIVDIDHFKLLNDTYGHQAGDECLVKVGALLEKFSNRSGDLCARYGGEEFALIWGDTSIDSAKRLAESLLSEIIDLGIPNRESPTASYMTASIGVAEVFPTRGSDESSLIAKADSALYKAKNEGRNRVLT